MRILTALLAPVLGSGTLPGTADEALDYATREAASPEAQEFVGGHGGVVLAVLIIGAFVLLFLLLKKEEKI